MPQATFPDPGPDDAEPGGFPLDEDAPGPEQGLYITLPAEHLTLSGFCQGGASDTMTPGPLLATVVHTVTGDDGSGLAGCSDDQLLGIISAARRLESRAAWTLMAATGEFARRAGTGVEGEFAADELASELHMSQQSAAGQMDFATEIPKRLPKTFAALGAGQIHPVHLRIIEDETRYLTDADAAKADAILAEAAPGKTFGELRYAARKLVLKLDPDIARKRKEAARREAHVRRFREESGNAGMVARELPSDEVLASWQHVEQRALDLRAAGMPGSLQDLRVRAYLDLLQERDSRAVPAGVVPAASGGAGQDQPAPDQPPSDQPSPDQRPSDQPPRSTGPARPRCVARPPQRPRRPGRSRWPGRSRPRSPPRPGRRPEPGRPGHHHHPPSHLPRPLRHPRRSRRVRPPRRRRRPRPGRRRRPPPQNPVVHHRPEPGRHRRRPRLPPRPPPPARHRTPRPPSTPRRRTTRHRASRHPGHPADPDHPRSLRPRPRRDRLPAQPQTPAPGPRPQRPVHRPGLRPARRPLRPGPYRPLGPGRHHLRMRSRSAMSPSPQGQTGPRLAASAARTRRPRLAHALPAAPTQPAPPGTRCSHLRHAPKRPGSRP